MEPAGVRPSSRDTQAERKGERTLEALVRLAAKPIAYIGSAVIFVGLVYLGIQLKDGTHGGGELRKAIAMIVAGGVLVAFVSLYGFAGF